MKLSPRFDTVSTIWSADGRCSWAAATLRATENLLSTVLIVIFAIPHANGQPAAEPPATVMQDHRSGCRAFAENHPNFHFAHGPGDDPCLFEPAPRSLNPMTASQQQLEEWGLPHRPSLADRGTSPKDFEQRLAFWKRMVAGLTNPIRHQTKSYTCTRNRADFAGPKSMWTACGTADGATIPDGIIRRASPNTGSAQHGLLSAPASSQLTNNQGGYLLTFPTQPPIGGGGNPYFIEVSGFTTIPSFLNTPRQC